jgi:hypothetical protein
MFLGRSDEIRPPYIFINNFVKMGDLGNLSIDI